jgi:hypothetical protein
MTPVVSVQLLTAADNSVENFFRPGPPGWFTHRHQHPSASTEVSGSFEGTDPIPLAHYWHTHCLNSTQAAATRLH